MNKATESKSAPERKWLRYIYPSPDGSDALFESLRQIYLLNPPDVQASTYLDLSSSDLKDPAHYFSHVETSTTYASHSDRARSWSFDSSGSHIPTKTVDWGSGSRFVSMTSAGLLAGLIASTHSYPNDRTPRVFNAMQGVSVGLLTAGGKALLRTTPVVGDFAALGIISLVQKSRLWSLRQSSAINDKQYARALRCSVGGGVGAIAGSRLGYMACQQGGFSEASKVFGSVVCSLVGSLLVRRLVDTFT